MKVIDIALKDLLRAFRSTLAIGFMFVVPMVITGLIYAAFGGMLNTSPGEAPSLPQVRVLVVNLDQGDAASGINAGQMLVDVLASDDLRSLLAVTETADAAAARAAVDRQEAAVAVILPQAFSQAAIRGEQAAVLELYQDPALAFGPGMVREIIDQFLDGFAGGRIAAGLVSEPFSANGLRADPALAGQAQLAYRDWLLAQNNTAGWSAPVEVRKPNQAAAETIEERKTNFLGPVMVGMLIFFVFFGATSMAQTIIKEQEEGTLARMFTTPTSITVILGGKFTSVFVMLIVQSIVLLLASRLAFGVNWGNLLTVALLVAGLVVAAAGFGVFLMSLVKTTRQAGPVTGGVLTFTGMAGGLMSTGMQSQPAFFTTLNRFVPQGWALHGFRLALAGAAPQDVLVTTGVLLLFGAVLFFIGARAFRTRFA